MTSKFDLEARKAQLAEAVWQVILTRGVAAVSVRTVAEQAGVVVGSLRHIFPTRAELVAFSAELMVQRATERVLATPWKDDPEEYVLAVISSLLPLTEDARAELEVNMALAAEAVAVPALVAIRDEAFSGLVEVSVRMIEILTGLKREDPSVGRVAQRLHALIDGLSFHLLHKSLDDDPTWALEVLKSEISAVRSGFDSRARLT